MNVSLGPPSAGAGYPPSEASAAGISPERSEHCEAMSLEVCSMRGVATPAFLLLLLSYLLKNNPVNPVNPVKKKFEGEIHERF